MTLNEKQRALCENHDFDFSDLKALYINCTLKPSPEFSHTEALMKVSEEIMAANGVSTDTVRAVDLTLPPGVYPDMREQGFEHDDWPSLCEKVMASNILVVGTPIWLGEESSVCRLIIERLYAESGKLNDSNQSIYYGRTGGCVITGNEDGVKHCSHVHPVRAATPRLHHPAAGRRRIGLVRPVRARLTATRIPAGRKTTSPSATPRS
ncbi:MAG: NAD(P)H-dependent oxidoreductase [Woeseiaceae bacterium]|nr:NAD(P)H-dependent oxidoreductase [Woeseiaceae bacterium]